MTGSWKLYSHKDNGLFYLHSSSHCKKYINNRDSQGICSHGIVLILLAFSGVTIKNVYPLRAKFYRGNINIYLHFVSFLYIDMTHVAKILPKIRQEPTYST